MAQVNVTISGKTYRMACNDGEEEHLSLLGQELNQTIDDLRGRFGEIGDQRLTVMAAITLADRYSESERRVRALEAEIAGLQTARGAARDRQGEVEDGVARSLETLAERLEVIAGRLDGDEER